MKKLILVLFFIASQAQAQTPLILAWDASANATNYNLLWGSSSGIYTVSQAVGNVTQATISLAPGTYFIAVNASDATGVSAPSNEVQTTIDPTCVPPLGVNSISIFPTAIQYTGSGAAGSVARVDFQATSPNSPINHLAVQSSGVNISPTTAVHKGVVDGTNIGDNAGLWFTLPAASGNYPLSILATNTYGCAQTQSTAYTIIIP